MKKFNWLLTVFLLTIFLVLVAFAQSSQEGMKGMEQGRQSMGTMQMGKAQVPMTEQMAAMCMRMMEKEMAAMPWLIAATGLFGFLITVAFVLLIILEVQWVRLWSRRLKQTSV